VIAVDDSKCVACGICNMACPREALRAWGNLEINRDRCTDCYGGLHQWEQNAPPDDKGSVLDTSRNLWRRACVESCPVNALSVIEN
jgi:ferredoxin